MGAGITGEGLLIIIAIALSIYVGQKTVTGAKWVGHKTKCGAMHIVGKHCEPPLTDAADPKE